jgi:aspartate kinase
VKAAHKLNDISYDEMLELASLGANVLHNRSVEMALKYNVTMEVKSSFEKVPGTKIKDVSKVEKMLVRGVTRDNDVALITVKGIDQKQKPFDVFKLLAKNNISVDIILLGENKVSGKDLTFTVAKKDEMAALEIVKQDLDFLSAKSVESDSNVSKVSIVGAGMTTNSGVASMAFEALIDNSIDIKLITTSEISVSMVVEETMAEKAVVALHEKFL